MFINELTIEELKDFFRKINEPSYRAEQTFLRIHKHLALNIDEFTELPRKLREWFSENHYFPTLNLDYYEAINDKSDDRGTQKFIFEYKDQKSSKNRIFESVWLVSEKRRTACISSQSGCSLNCTFCATAKIPFKGNLSTWQILQQVYYMIRFRNQTENTKERLTNIVFMGMGEPFYNYDNVIKAAKILNHPLGLNIGSRHITISTAGVIPSIERFIAEKQPFNLAISLNHPFNEGRMSLMDINQRYPLKELLKVVKKYTEVYKKNITFEYILIPDVNMTKEHINELVKIAKYIKYCKFNLIPLNTNFNNWRTPEEEEVLAFQKELRKNGILAFYRGSPGKKINAACGMLALQKKEMLI
ncbi:MAG: putative dual-specificity RNA methyltransferase RlmN [Leptospiraceae bacterium]|nr:MAG: putative dual-specificity RNA methyltransferase RlmN [Leptospiraceae bacterium]